MDTNLPLWGMVSGTATVLVAVAAVVWSQRNCRCAARWYSLGAQLWALAVCLKLLFSYRVTSPALEMLLEKSTAATTEFCAAVLLGLQSSLFEIGLVFAAGLVWRRLGDPPGKTVCIGVGAGAFEALLLGLAGMISMSAVLVGAVHNEDMTSALKLFAATTPLFWLVAPVERVIAILTHTASRSLVLTGIFQRKPARLLGGFFLFALLDSIAAWPHVTGALQELSLWWIELALLPCGAISLYVLTRIIRATA